MLKTILACLRLGVLGPPQAVRPGAAAFWALSLVAALVRGALAWLTTEPPRAFDVNGAAGAALSIVCLLAVAWLLARALGDESLTWSIAALVTGAGLVIEAVTGLAYSELLAPVEDPRWRWIGWGGALLWWAGIVLRVLQSMSSPVSLLRLQWLAACAVGLLGLESLYLPHPRFWTTDYFERYRAEQAQAPEPLVAERVFESQAARVDAALGRMPRGVAGTPELYFVAFGPYGGQDVFLKESLYATRLFRERFAAGARTLTLVNHRDHVDQLPLADLSNLRRVLSGIGARMNRDEDIVFLFLTSHGSRDAQLSVELEDLSFEPLSADALAAALRESGIRWRVLVVSGCYSGSFLPALKDEHALVITAARADRTSFGCSDGADFTWFGRAYFEQALQHTTSFTAAYAEARQLIEQWETAENYAHSEPQIAAGTAIEAQLRRWSATLPAATTRAAAPAGPPADPTPPREPPRPAG